MVKRYTIVTSNPSAVKPTYTRYGAYLKLARELRKLKFLNANPHGYVIDTKTGEVLIFMNR